MASMLFKTLIGFGAITPPPKCSPLHPNSTRNAPISCRNSYSRFGFSVHSRIPLFDAAFSVGFGAMRRGFGAFNAVSSGGSGGDGGFRGWDGNGGSSGGDDEDGDDVFLIFQWYSMALDKHPVLTKSITSALLTLIGDSISQLMIEQASKLDLKRSLIFTTLGFVLVGPTLHFWYLSLSKLVTTTGASGAFVCLLLDQEWPSSMVANWQLWIPFQFLIFRFVPQQFQVLATDFVALAWNAILSFKAHREVVLK